MDLFVKAVAHAQHAGSNACQKDSGKSQRDARIRHPA
jgi:hypothetical protein